MIKNDSSENVFPIIFGRKGGAEINLLTAMKSDALLENMKSLLVSQSNLQQEKEVLTTVLHQKIKENNGENKVLLNLKRAVYNDRNLAKYVTNDRIEVALQKSIKTYVLHSEMVAKSFELYETQFETDIYNSATNLDTIANHDFLKNGLLYASQILYNEIKKDALNFTSFNKKKNKLVVTTLKYITRSITKTSPFSSFNNIFCLEKNGENFSATKSNITFSIQVHNILFYYIKQELLAIYDFKNGLNIQLNTTIWKDENQLHFFVNKENNEALKKLSLTPVLNFIKETLDTKKATYNELVSLLVNATSQDIKDVENFIEVLIKEGFLEVIFPTTQHQKEWFSDLLSYSKDKDFNNSEIETIVTVLELLKVTKIQLEQSENTDDKKRIINDSYQKIASHLTSINQDIDLSKKVNAQELFYEDTFKQIDENISAENYEKINRLLKKAYTNLNPFSYKLGFKTNFRESLVSNHQGKLSLLEFYENIYLKEKQSSYTVNEEGAKECQRILVEVQKYKTNESIDLAEICTSNLKSTVAKSSAFGAYIQISDGNFSKIILNNFSKGYGANCSRFFNNCSDTTIKKVCEWNDTHNAIITDVKDASIHNTNIYPSLTDNVVYLTDSKDVHKKHERIISLAELYVTVDDEKGIKIINKSGQEVLPVQFSLEGLNRKSKFCQFLDIFNPNDVFGYNIITEHIKESFEKELQNEDIIRIPRLTYENDLILKRQKWLVKSSMLKDILDKNAQSNAALFYNLNKWRIAHHIPSEVFIRTKKQTFTKGEGNQYKPQYINFNLSIFTVLIKSLLKNVDDVIEFSEMLPTSSSVKENSGFVKEYIINTTA